MKVAWNKGLTGEKSHWFGRKHTEKDKKKASESLKKYYQEHPEVRLDKQKIISKSKEHPNWINNQFKKGHKVIGGFENRFKKGQVGWNKGKTSKEDARIRCREQINTWHGGISFEPYGLEFNNKLREQIRGRDQFRCQECFRHQNELNDKKLAIHHIDFNKKNNDSKNLISLCRSCHAQTNFNRNQWINYFQNRMMESGKI